MEEITNSPGYWEVHGLLFLLGVMFFPRITLALATIFTTFMSGGLLWWLGWLFTPHLLVAILSLPFFNTNPIMVICAWIWAFVGTGAESQVKTKK